MTLRIVHASNEAFVEATSREFVELAQASVVETGRCVVALAGGRTPKTVYSHLAKMLEPSLAKRLHLFFGDERCVPPVDTRSNYRMTFEALLQHVAIPRGQVHRMRGEDPQDVAAKAYEAEILAFFDGKPPRFDLVVLGLGPDAHTASLFPGSLPDARGLAIAAHAPAEIPNRLSLTPALFNQAKNIRFWVTGADKARAVRDVLAPERDLVRLPAQRIAPEHGSLMWHLDQGAAELL